MDITTISETVEMIPSEKLVIESKGQINGQTTWTLTPDETGTQVRIHYEYAEPENTLRAVASVLSSIVVRSTLYEIAANAQERIQATSAK